MANRDRCLGTLQQPRFAEQLWTDRLSVPEVAERVAASAELDLIPDTNGPARRRLRQAWASARHIQLR